MLFRSGGGWRGSRTTYRGIRRGKGWQAGLRARVVRTTSPAAGPLPARRWVWLSSDPIRAMDDECECALAGECRALQFPARRLAGRRPRKPIGDKGRRGPDDIRRRNGTPLLAASMFLVRLSCMFPVPVPLPVPQGAHRVRAAPARKEWHRCCTLLTASASPALLDG